ncbi:glycosyl hydrolase 115 family protein [Flavobacterium flavipallidum]|uniref:Glycosyl hydrolase 115 family protein n=1 Tax=Flavobacterium flavipallidum TaxID=3139140 RepID=A0ABU9HI91_9FLAO
MFKNKFNIIFLVFIALFANVVKGQNNDFAIVSANQKAAVLVEEKEPKVVHIAAKILADDVFSITNKRLIVSKNNSEITIMAGTIGQSKWIDNLVSKQKITVADVKGKWETYKIQVVENPTAAIKKALVIVGSDRRATAYGLLEISRMMGVSPWEWWADVTPDKKDNLVLNIQTKVYGSPSVKYRGIFLNDEDWGLQPWAAKTFEPETGDIGPKTYAKVFELLLRLRANTIWPAMHKSTKAFYSFPKNKEVADDYAIVIGTSHAEPMLSNINAEWNHNTMGEYRYDTNSGVIKNFFKKRTKETAPFENIYTIGMRGEHDSPMIVGEDDSDAQVKLLEQVITDQRAILKKETKKEPNKIPQVFIPYKEVLDYYQKGLKLPEDVQLVWTDDNYGYIRQLSNPKEQKRPGGAGIYYHTSYWGRPHDYLWLNSSNPVLMWEEMEKAYEFQSRDLWILNCGDIKPHEYNIELFLDMAWDMTPFDKSQSVKTHMQNWASREFGTQNANSITDLFFDYYHLAFQRRPEFMAWNQVEPETKSKPTELTQIHYGDEVSKRIDAYQKLMDTAEKLKTAIPANRQDAFYELIEYPVIGAASLNHKWLYSYKNKFVAEQGRGSAAFFAKKSATAFERIQKETQYFNNELAGGKWKHIMSMSPRFLPVFDQATSTNAVAGKKPELKLALESYEMEVNHRTENSYADVLPVFNAYVKNQYYIDVFMKGEGTVNWQAKPKADWIKISQQNGTLDSKESNQQRLWVSIDWDKVPKGENKKEAPLGHDYQLIPPSYKVNSAIEFVSQDTLITVGVSAFNPKFAELENYKGFVEDKGYVSINAVNYSNKKDGVTAKWETFEGIGYAGKVSVALPRTANSEVDLKSIKNNSPVMEYDFFTFNFGEAKINVQVVPTHAFYEGKGVRCAVAIDDAEPVILNFQTFGRSDEWMQNVLKNAAVKSAKQIVNKAGKHTLKVWMVDPGVMIDQVLIDLGGWKDSYAFPPETKM